MKNNNGGPAFPNVPDGAGGKWSDWDHGMTLRDYFAAKALAGMLSGPAGRSILNDETPGSASLHATGELSYEIADAMLKARRK